MPQANAWATLSGCQEATILATANLGKIMKQDACWAHNTQKEKMVADATLIRLSGWLFHLAGVKEQQAGAYVNDCLFQHDSLIIFIFSK